MPWISDNRPWMIPRITYNQSSDFMYFIQHWDWTQDRWIFAWQSDAPFTRLDHIHMKTGALKGDVLFISIFLQGWKKTRV